jgi:HK97 family phage major capsid protein
MKRFKNFLVQKGISDADFKAKSIEDQTELYNEFMEKSLTDIETLVNDKATAETVTGLKKELSDFMGKMKDLNVATIKEMEENIKELQAKQTSKTKVTLLDELKAKKEAIKKVLRGGDDVELKALTNTASIGSNTDALKLPDIGQLGRVERSLYNIFPKFQVADGDNNGTVRYHDWNESTTVAAATAIAEGGTYPESTAKFTEYTLKLKKVGDTLPVTEEFGEDEVSASAELQMFLETNVDSKCDSQIAIGDGVDEEMLGLIPSVPAYTAVAEGISDANIHDLVKRMRTKIVKNRGSKYKPDFVVMNADTIDLLGLKKDKNDNYLFRNDAEKIGQIFIIEDNNVPDNQLVVGDRRFARIYEKAGVVISEGHVNAQFTSDTKTLKVRKRMLFLIRNVDKTGFLKCTDVAAAFTTLETAPA